MDIPQFNYSPVEGPLGRFWSWAFMNKIAINFLYRFLCDQEFSFRWDKGPEMQLAGLHGSVCSVFQKLPNCFLVAVPFCKPTSKLWVNRFLQILSSIWCCHYFFFFNFSHQYVEIPHCGFLFLWSVVLFFCTFLRANDVEPSFLGLLAISIAPSVKCAFHVCLFSNRIICFY